MSIEEDLKGVEGGWNCEGCYAEERDVRDPGAIVANAIKHQKECPQTVGDADVHIRFSLQDRQPPT